MCYPPNHDVTNSYQNSSCYFLGDKDGDSLQRIYGVAFPDKKLLNDHLKFLEEAAKRDHRRIGTAQELFMFDEIAPGCPFILPHGNRIFNAIQTFLREQYFLRGYQEVQTPNMFSSDLWKMSGHWAHYEADMFRLDVEKRVWGLKPMNCPGHCKIFASRERTYRELPLRMADFGVLHRNEASGALAGLTRVRKFQQDDAHIFCTLDQITGEIEGYFDFFSHVYKTFGMDFSLKLSTRPQKYMGELETWNTAEAKLTEALNNFCKKTGRKWELNPEDGAFYGPKIDIEVYDTLGRGYQTATMQADFQLPQNFQLEYATHESTNKTTKEEEASDGTTTTKPKGPGPGRARPVILHRAIVGSFERFMGIIIEHFAGRWPFWLSPRQVLVVPVMPALNEYVEEVQLKLRKRGLYADIDIGGNTMPKKILRGQQQMYNFIFGKF
jgi:threonyl-tRNA synthetase